MGSRPADRRGAGEQLEDWRVFPLPLDDLRQVDCAKSRDEEEPGNSGPTFFRRASLAGFSLV